MTVFDYADRWIFLAIARCNGGDLSDLIGVADHINCCVPLKAEISTSVAKLRAAGLVIEVAGAFQLSSQGIILFERCGGLSAAPRSQFEAVSKVLAEVNLPQFIEPYLLNNSKYQIALAKYTQSIQA